MQQPSGALSLAIAHIDALLESDDIVLKIKHELSVARLKCAAVLDEVAGIEDYIRFVPAAPAMPLQSVFENLGSGRINLLDKDDAIIRPSCILGPMFLKGFNFTSAYRFSATEMDLANFIGDHFDQLSPALRALRSPKKERNDENFQIAFPERNDHAFGQLLALNARFKIIEIKALKFPAKDGTMFTLKANQQGKVASDQKGVFVFRFTEGPTRGLILGDWLTAYVHGIIHDQLQRRARVEHELYAKLNYSAPGDVVNHKSDFDVIGRFGKSVIMFECKSGKITPQVASEVIAKTNDLVRALELQEENDQTTELHLVYDPHINVAEDVAGYFADTAINLLTPQKVRKLVRDVTSDLTA